MLLRAISVIHVTEFIVPKIDTVTDTRGFPGSEWALGVDNAGQ